MQARQASRRLQQVQRILGEFEKDNSIPKYNVLELREIMHGQRLSEISVSELWACIYALWTIYHIQENIPVSLSSSLPDVEVLTSFLLQSLLARKALDPAENTLFLLRSTFWQADYSLFPHTQSFTRSSAVIAQHPLRPPKPPKGKVIYRRYCSEVGRMLSFHVVKPDDTADVEAFHYWMNDERVDEWWGERGDLAKHRAYIQRALNDPTVLPLIMSWDGERMGYIVLTWIQENHLAPYIPNGAQNYDRGVHLLVGEDKFRGPAYSRAWVRYIHYIFLAGPRTERFIGEPKRSNTVVL
ncbi:hypothetical protein ACEPAH_3 [Sanghuangporus vaninii]